MQFFKKKYPWYVEESMENIKYFDNELERLHKLCRLVDEHSRPEIVERITILENHVLAVGQRIAGIKY